MEIWKNVFQKRKITRALSLSLLIICAIALPAMAADNRQNLENDLIYYNRAIKPMGADSRIGFLKRVIKKYNAVGLNEIYLFPLEKEIEEIEKTKDGTKLKEVNSRLDKPERRRPGNSAERYSTELSAGRFNFKASFNTSGKMGLQDSSDSWSFDVKDAVAVSLEYFSSNFGLGLSYQLPRELDIDGYYGGSGKFWFMPVYLLFRSDSAQGQPYVTANLGYNFFNGDSKFKEGDKLSGGLYYGAGLGIDLSPQMFIELFYAVNKGKISWDAYSDRYYDYYRDEWYYYYVPSGDVDIEYKQINLSIGYRFGVGSGGSSYGSDRLPDF